ncbi:hypothetical protein F66182_18297, partial [Fusarium sp. NRRL 66182]
MRSSPPVAPTPAPVSQGPSGIDAEVMLAFYQRLFPFRPMFQWLNHGVVPSPDMVNREFAVFLQNEAVLRYQSFATVDLTNPRDRKSRP